MTKMDYAGANARARGLRDHDYLSDWESQNERASLKKRKKPKPQPQSKHSQLSKREVEHLAFMRRTQKGLLSMEVAASKSGRPTSPNSSR